MDKRLLFIREGDFETTVAVPLGLQYTQSVYDSSGQLRNRLDMAIEAFAYFESLQHLHGATLTSVIRDKAIIEAEMRLELMTPQNWVSIPAPFNFSRYHGEGGLPEIVPGIPDFFKAWDYSKMNRICGGSMEYRWFCDNVFKYSCDGSIPGLPWVPNRVMSLRALAAQKYSVYNRMFTGDKIGPYTVNSCSNVYPHKLHHLTTKYDKPTRTCSSASPSMGRFMGTGLRRMYRYMGTDKYFGQLVWDFHEKDVLNMSFPERSSAGIRSGSVYKVKVCDGVTVTTTPNGTKGDQEKFAKGRVLDYIEQWRRNRDIKFIEKASCICLKHEIFNSSKINPADRDRTYNKCREFFIMNIVQYIIAALVMKDRQMFERGRMIKVGMRWWRGGAQYFADQMKYNDPEMEYFDGDFDALDTTIKKFLLEVYESQAGVYYKEGEGDWFLFEALLKLATENLSVKMVHIFAKVWKIMFGVMPSGAYETSHGNSWIVGWLFWSYVEYIILTRPDRGPQIEKCFVEGKIEFPCYGDDHVPAVHKSISDIINEEGFIKFVADFFQMKIHKQRNNIPFISVPDNDGGLLVDGVIFLKRRFIRRPDNFPKNLPDVLPYKTLDDMLVKLAWGNNPRLTLIDYAISAIGLAYDGMATNIEIHNMCEQLFIYCIRKAGVKSMEDLVAAFFAFSSTSKKDVTQSMRKIGIPVEVILQGFPSREHLLSLHEYDAAYVDFTPSFRRWSPAHVTAFEDKTYVTPFKN